MKIIVSVISGSHADYRSPHICRIAHIGFQKRIPSVRAIIIPKAQINRHRHSKRKRLPYQIVNPLHQLRCPRERIFPWRSKLYCNNVTVISHSSVNSAGCSSIAGSNPQNGCPMSAEILLRNKQSSLVLRQSQRPVYLLFPIFCSQVISFRRFSHIPGFTLIPQFQNPACSVLSAEIRMPIIHSGIYNSNQHASAAESPLPA